MGLSNKESPKKKQKAATGSGQKPSFVDTPRIAVCLIVNLTFNSLDVDLQLSLTQKVVSLTQKV